MGTAFICRRGGSGGADLNYSVVGGTTAPSSPGANTIWVNTSTSITSHVFSATQPLRVSDNKNLLVYPFYFTTQNINGITFTDNKDGTVKANGTATETSYFRHSNSDANGLPYTGILEPGTYTLSGCPAGGGSTAFGIELGYSFDDFGTTTWAKDTGSGATFTITKQAVFRCAMVVYSGATVSNIVFKPQLEKGSTATSFVKGDATGKVWFEVGTSCAAPMSITKKDIIVLYPINCKQCENGKWVSKTAKTYQDGSWKDWRTYFFKSGEGALVPFTVRGYSSAVSGAVGTDYIQIKSTGNNNGERGCTTDSAIDITEFNMLYFDVLASTSNFYVGASTELIKYKTDLAKSELITASDARQVVAVDISSLSGAHYIGGNNRGDKTTTVQIYNIYAS